jgi:hypothetical protein
MLIKLINFLKNIVAFVHITFMMIALFFIKLFLIVHENDIAYKTPVLIG